MIIALTTSSKGRTAKLAAAIKKALSDDDTVTAAFRYPVHKIARMFGWDNRLDERGRKLVETLYNAGTEYNKDLWLDKMEKFISRGNVSKKTIIITDVDSHRQVEMLKKMDNVKIIVCGDSSILGKRDLLDVQVDSDVSIDDAVSEIMREAACTRS